MVFKVCILCDKVVQEKDKVDYDVFASMFKYDCSGDIVGNYDKLVPVFFHLKCFNRFRKDERKKQLYFTQEVGSKRIVIKSGSEHKIYSM